MDGPAQIAADAANIDSAGTKLVLLCIALLIVVFASISLAWRKRQFIGEVLRRFPQLHFALIVVGFAAAAVVGLFTQGLDSKRLIDGLATREEFNLCITVAIATAIGLSVATATWLEGYTSTAVIADLNRRAEQSGELIQAAQRESEFAKAVNRLFLGVVGKKTERFLQLGDELQDMAPSTPTFVKRIHQAHDPLQQCIEMLAATWSILHLHLAEQGYTSISLRIALFCVDGESLKVELSTDGRRSGVVKGPTRHGCKDHFSLGAIKGQSLASQATFSQEILIEPDTTIPIDQLRTHYRPHDDSHHRRISSIVAIPLGLPLQPGQPCRRVLCADTNIKNGFLPEHLDRLELIRDNLEQRLLIEIIQAGAFRPPSRSRKPRNATKPAVTDNDST